MPRYRNFTELLETDQATGNKYVKRFLKPGEIPAQLFLDDARKTDIDPDKLEQFIERAREDGSLTDTYSMRTHDTLDKIVLTSPEVQQFRKDLQPYINEGASKRIAERLAAILYNQLSDDDKAIAQLGSICTRILTLPFKQKRPSHREAFNFVVTYPALFKNETEVVDSILERYLDEELSKTPIAHTHERIRQLKQKATEFYGAVNHDPATPPH